MFGAPQLPSLDTYVEAWKALLQLRDDGLARSIGVSNFLPEHIARLYEETAVVPALNQVELHPGFPQDELRAFHAKHGIQTVAYSPLGRGPAGFGADLLGGESIAAVAAAHGVTPAQAVLRWHIQLGSIPLARTSNPSGAGGTSTCSTSSSPQRNWTRFAADYLVPASASTRQPTWSFKSGSPERRRFTSLVSGPIRAPVSVSSPPIATRTTAP